MKTTYTTKDFKRDVRQAYAWLGGYALVFYTSDGAMLCNHCARKEARNIIDSIMHCNDDGWRVVGCAMETVSPECTREMAGDDYISHCEHCNAEIGEIG